MAETLIIIGTVLCSISWALIVDSLITLDDEHKWIAGILGVNLMVLGITCFVCLD